MTLRRIGAAAVAVVLGGAWLASPAGAAVVERFSDSWTESETVVCDLGTKDEADDIVVESVVQGSISVMLRTRGPNGSTYAKVSGEEFGTNTNVATGRSWTITYRWNEADLRLIKSEGNVNTYLTGVSFHFVVYGPDGRVDSRNDGRSEFLLAVDMTTGEGSFVEGTKFAGHFGAGEFCDDAVRFTTG